VQFHCFDLFLAEYESRFERETMDDLEFIARVVSHIPDKGQVMVRHYGLYANAHRGKIRKAGLSPFLLRLAEEEEKGVPSKGWAAMIRKVYEVDPRPGLSFFRKGRQRFRAECGQGLPTQKSNMLLFSRPEE